MKDKKTFGVKALAALAAVALALGCVIGGTMAWLTDKTDAVTNTLTTSDIGVTLTESEDLDLKMIPGYTIFKDPKVTVKANSEKCYLFVKVEESDNFDNFMTYEIALGWTELTEGSGVFYRIVDSSPEAQVFGILAGDVVAVNDTVTKEMMTADNFTRPTLTFTAYASQYYKTNPGTTDSEGKPDDAFTPAEAWSIVNPTPTT